MPRTGNWTGTRSPISVLTILTWGNKQYNLEIKVLPKFICLFYLTLLETEEHVCEKLDQNHYVKSNTWLIDRKSDIQSTTLLYQTSNHVIITWRLPTLPILMLKAWLRAHYRFSSYYYHYSFKLRKTAKIQSWVLVRVTIMLTLCFLFFPSWPVTHWSLDTGSRWESSPMPELAMAKSPSRPTSHTNTSPEHSYTHLITHMKWNESALILSVFKNPLRASLSSLTHHANKSSCWAEQKH